MKKRGKKEVSNKKKIDKNVEKEKVCEIFDIEKNGKEETIKSCGIEEEKIVSSGQIKKEKKIFITLIIILLGFVLIFVAFLLLNYYSTHFKVGGVQFEVDKTTLSGTTIYKTIIPGIIDDSGKFIPGIYSTGKQANYRIWFRNDPRRLEDIPFSGDITLLKNVVLNMTNSFNCDGDGIIAIANLQKTYNTLGAKMITDKNATCDNAGRYTFLRISEGNETKISEYNSNGECYEMEINNCEILPATEKFMLEILIKVNKEMKKGN
jgi:hypothetical protein